MSLWIWETCPLRRPSAVNARRGHRPAPSEQAIQTNSNFHQEESLQRSFWCRSSTTSMIIRGGRDLCGMRRTGDSHRLRIGWSWKIRMMSFSRVWAGRSDLLLETFGRFSAGTGVPRRARGLLLRSNRNINIWQVLFKLSVPQPWLFPYQIKIRDI